MIDVEHSVVIRRPIEDVFAFVAEQRNAPQWQSGLLEVRRTTDGPLGVGTRHAAVREFMGRRMELTNEYVEYEPNKKITFNGDSGQMYFEVSYRTESAADGTRISCQMQMQPRGLLRLAQPLIAAGLRRDFKANLRNLKDLLENPSTEMSS